LTAHRGRPNHGRTREHRRLLGQLLEASVPVVDQIPLVRHEEQGPSGLQDAERDLLVLGGEPLARVEDDPRGVRPIDRRPRPDEAVVLDALDADRATHAGRVDEPHPPRSRPLHERVHAVAGRPSLLEHHRPLLPHQPVEKARLPNVRSPDEREPRLVVVRGVVGLTGAV
jgi:hypothetical protein